MVRKRNVGVTAEASKQQVRACEGCPPLCEEPEVVAGAQQADLKRAAKDSSKQAAKVSRKIIEPFCGPRLKETEKKTREEEGLRDEAFRPMRLFRMRCRN